MSENAIVVENLSKTYLIGHRFSSLPGGYQYTALRDVVSHEVRNFARKSADLFRGKQIVQGDKVEEFRALRDVNFEVKRGEVLGIIGRNGAGKSTLLKILSRITEPTQGRVLLRGRVASLLEVGTGFHRELSGRENIFLNGAILGMTRAEINRKFDEIVAFAEVERFLDTSVKHYSSGMYVRLAFAVAAHLESEILIVDEVLAVGDVRFQSKCLGKMRDVSSKQGRTILFVSHNIAAMQSLCGRAILLREGSIVEDGDPNKIISGYMAEASDTGRVPLRDWKDRVTNKDGKIVDLEVLDERGSHVTSVLLGDKLRLMLTIEFYRPVVRMQFGIFVHSVAGEGILELRSSHDGLYFDSTGTCVTVEVVVDELRLYPGEYTLSPWVYDLNSTIEIDWVQHCCKLLVLPAPGAHGALSLTPQYGKYFVPSSWSIRNYC
jgi:lipopolysaccharide transport system ATP-binding protein